MSFRKVEHTAHLSRSIFCVSEVRQEKKEKQGTKNRGAVRFLLEKEVCRKK